MPNHYDIDLLNAAFAAVMKGENFISVKEFQKRQTHHDFDSSVYQSLDLDSIHQFNLVGGAVNHDRQSLHGINPPLSLLYVKTLTGKIVPLKFRGSDTIYNIKLKIQAKEGVPPSQQRLVFGGKKLEDDKMCADYRIKNGSTLHISFRVRGGRSIFSYLDSNILDPMYHYDFTNIDDEGKTYMRGGIKYQRPCGWRRFAVKVSGKYDNGDDTWLGTGKNSWPVSYHGTANNNAKSIAVDGYLLSKGKRFSFGHGIYSTPNIEVAEMYAPVFKFEGKKYVIVIQNRVNPVNLHKIPKQITGVGEYWISNKDADVRPYGICIKRKDN